MKRRTKIVCTLGPALDSKAQIKQFISAGMNVARFNCSHGDWETRIKWREWIRESQPKIAPVGVLVDLQGPKFRIGPVPEDKLVLSAGQELTLAQRGECTITVADDVIWSAMEPGDRLLLGDGVVELKLGDKNKEIFECEAVSGGLVRSRQGVTLVGKSFDVPALTEKDKADVYEAVKMDTDFIALSYVRCAADMRELRKLVDEYDPSLRLVAKIETREALENLDEILEASDAIMVARGDLGLQMDIEDVPVAQKRIISKCNAVGKPVITATQMLESMMRSPRPTRAEASDVANAILDGTDAVMLSGETAVGKYPLEALETMGRIAGKIEGLVDHQSRMRTGRGAASDAETDSVAHAAVELSDSLKATAILTSTTSGTTPRLVSRYRPAVPILCACWTWRTQRQLSLVWGVEAVQVELPTTTDEGIERAVEVFLNLKRIKAKDKVIVTAGVPAGVPGNTNMLLVLDV